MPTNYGQESNGELPRFRTDQLVLVTTPGHALFDENALLPVKEDLVASIMAVGVLEPILVRENGRHPHEPPTPKSGQRIIEIVAGRKRYKALVEANRRLAEAGKEPHLMPCIMKRAAGDAETAHHILIAENELRYADPPSLRAKKAAAMKETGASIESIAIAFGIPVEQTKQLIALAGLDKSTKAAIDAGSVKLRDAPKLRQIPEAERKKLVEESEASPRAAKIARKKIAKEAKGRTAPARTYVRNVRTKDEIAAAIDEAKEAYGEGGSAKITRALEWVLGQRETWQ